MPSFSLVGALEFRNVVASLQHDAPDVAPANMWDSIASLHSTTPYAGGHYHSHNPSRQHSRGRTPGRTPSQAQEVNPWDETLAMPLSNRSPPNVTVTAENPDGEAMTPYLEEMSRSFPSISEGDDTESTYVTPPKKGVRYVLGHIAHTLFPSLHNFHNQTILGMVASVFAAPAIMLLTLTLPVVVSEYECEHPTHEKPNRSHNLVDFEEEGEERALIAEDILRDEMHEMGFNKWLMAAQCVFGPLFCIGVLFRASTQVRMRTMLTDKQVEAHIIFGYSSLRWWLALLWLASCWCSPVVFRATRLRSGWHAARWVSSLPLYGSWPLPTKS